MLKISFSGANGPDGRHSKNSKKTSSLKVNKVYVDLQNFIWKHTINNFYFWEKEPTITYYKNIIRISSVF